MEEVINEVEEVIDPTDQALLERDWLTTEDLWRSLVEDKGFVLIRLNPTSKVPYEPRWKNKVHHRPFDRIGLQESMNAGIITGANSGIIVLDVDNPEEFQKLNRELPPTFTVKTAKGAHYYFKIPDVDTDLYRNRAKGSYDIRATMGYVVAPGSIHPSGIVYEIINDIAPVEPPQWILDESKAHLKAIDRLQVHQKYRKKHGQDYEDLKEVDIRSIKVAPQIYERITEGYPEDTDDRSKVDFGVICSLLKAGCSDAEIKWIFTQYSIGGKSDEHPDKYGYLQTTIDNAFEAVADEIEDEESLTDTPWRTVALPDEDTLDAPYRTLCEYASRDLRRILEEHGNTVTPQRTQDLRKVITTYCAMANRKIQGRIAFPLPTGYGKTTSIVAFLARASSMGMLGFKERHVEFSIAITAFKVSELCNLKRSLVDAGVPEELICLHHSYRYNEDYLDTDGNSTKTGYAPLPATYKVDPETGAPMKDSDGKPLVDTRRPILLLTHNKAKTKGEGDFEALISGRTMLIWDESMLSTEAGAVSVMKIGEAISRLENASRSLQYSMNDTAHLKDIMEFEGIRKTAKYLQTCLDEVWEEIGRQHGGLPKRVLPFDAEPEILHGEMIGIIDELLRLESSDRMAECLGELKLFTRITRYEAAVELNRTNNNHMVVRFEIVMPDAVENIVILDASTWINVLMKLDKTIALPEGIQATLSYDGTTLYRIPFNSGRGEIFKELQTNDRGLLDTIEEIVRRHPNEAILFFTPKERDGVNSQALIEDYLQSKGHNIHAGFGDTFMRFNWMTHGNYTASNKLSHCTVMIFVGMLHKPQYVYRAQAIAQTRDLTTTITKADEARIKAAGHATDAHQGINRGAGRVIKGDTAQPVNAYFTYLNNDLVEYLSTVMPGAKHEVYDTETLKPKTQFEACIRATKKYLEELPETIRKISKWELNKSVPEMSDAGKTTREKVSVHIAALQDIPWRSEKRSWVRC